VFVGNLFNLLTEVNRMDVQARDRQKVHADFCSFDRSMKVLIAWPFGTISRALEKSVELSLTDQ
jgi:hypothetical protein